MESVIISHEPDVKGIPGKTFNKAVNKLSGEALLNGNVQCSKTVTQNSTRFKTPCFSCLQVFLCSFLVITLICSSIIFFRKYIRDVIQWMTEIDFYFSCIIYLLLFLVVSFPLVWGYLLLIISAGYLYGLLCGTAVVEFCASCGVLVSHLILQRTCNRRILQKFYNDKIGAIVRIVESDQGFKVVILARLTPIPFGLQNAIFAMTQVCLPKYCLASSIGLLPMAVLNCYLGSTLHTIKDVLEDSDKSSTAYFIFAIQIVLTVCFMGFVVRKAREELARTVNSKNSLPDSAQNRLVSHLEV